jgi:glycosyltransferase involved in cell wall biosynthesis
MDGCFGNASTRTYSGKNYKIDDFEDFDMISLSKPKSAAKEQLRDPNEQPFIDTGILCRIERIPFFSVCIPTYNRAQMLPAAIESVLNQNFVDFELIICDNASTDNTEEVVKGYCDQRLRYVCYETLVSMYANHNRCLNLAQGDWIVFLHSDDLMTDLNLAQAIVKDLQDKMSTCFPSVYLNQESTYKEWSFLEILKLMNGISPSGSIYRKDALKEIGGFAEDNIIADWELLLNMSFKKGGVYSYSSKPFVKRIVHSLNARIKSIKDGSAHFGKSQCVKRFFSKVSRKDFDLIASYIIQNWEKPAITQFYFYLVLSGLQENAELIKKLSYNYRKHVYFSTKSFYAFIVKHYGKEVFFSLYTKLRSLV